MKNFTLAAFLLLFFSVGAFAQQRTTASGWITFDNYQDPDFQITFDRTHTKNVWQVGKPNKTMFKNAYSAPYCIVTDTLDSYPVSDTSIFIIKQKPWWLWDPTMYPTPNNDTASLSGYYQVNSDTITDYGTIEFSPDRGITWIDVLKDTVFNAIRDTPVLSGNSGGWKYFRLNFYNLVDSFKGHYSLDSIFFRFSFISDSIQTNKDGLMYDDLHFIDFHEAVPTISTSKFTSTISPNPSSSFINISFETVSSHSYNLSVCDYSGRIIRRMENIREHKLTLTTEDLPPGMYHYTIRDEQDGKYSDGKFVVVH